MLLGLDFVSARLHDADGIISETLKHMRGAVKRADTIVKRLIDFANLAKLLNETV